MGAVTVLRYSTGRQRGGIVGKLEVRDLGLPGGWEGALHFEQPNGLVHSTPSSGLVWAMKVRRVSGMGLQIPPQATKFESTLNFERAIVGKVYNARILRKFLCHSASAVYIPPTIYWKADHGFRVATKTE
jgi:hypothetical protein